MMRLFVLGVLDLSTFMEPFCMPEFSFWRRIIFEAALCPSVQAEGEKRLSIESFWPSEIETEWDGLKGQRFCLLKNELPFFMSNSVTWLHGGIRVHMGHRPN